MQSHVQRRRQFDVFRPRQPRNDVNAGSKPVPSEADPSSEETTPEERLDVYVKRCAQRHLI